MKKTIKFVWVFFLLIAIFFTFAVLSSWLPDTGIKKHIDKAAISMQKAGDYPNAIIDDTPCRQDNYTDALILNLIYGIDRSTPIRSAMSNNMQGSSVTDLSETGTLLLITQKDLSLYTFSYARYWHGTTFLGRFLLTFLSYSNLQWLLFATSVLLFVIFICLYYPRAGLWKTIALMLSWVLVNGFVTQFSLQFFPVWAITLIASILIIRFNDKSQDLGILMFIIGAVTCYFDLLTTPLLSLGWPLVVWLSLQDPRDVTLKQTLWQLIRWSLLWGLGFALSFVTKWILGTLIIGTNVIKDALKEATTVVASQDLTHWDAITANLNMLSWNMVLIALIIVALFTIWRFRYRGGMQAVLFLCIALIPFVWYFIVFSHSYLHFWFTYRLLAVSIAAILMAMLSFTKERKLIS